MVSNVRIRDLKRKLVKGHKITIQEWVNKTNTNICRYLVLDDIVKYQEFPSSNFRYEIFNCNTYGFFDKIEDAAENIMILFPVMLISILPLLEMLLRALMVEKKMTLILSL